VGSIEILQKSWPFYNFLFQSVMIFLENFPNFLLTMFLRTFLKRKMTNFWHRKNLWLTPIWNSQKIILGLSNG
jgi:hypothetical protein